jgi:hypothetical protein
MEAGGEFITVVTTIVDTKGNPLKTSLQLQTRHPLNPLTYIDKDGVLTEHGVNVTVMNLVDGLAGMIEFAHKSGYKNEKEHIREIIEILGERFASIKKIKVG